MSDTAAVLAAIAELQAECRKSQSAVLYNAPKYFGLALSALEALVKLQAEFDAPADWPKYFAAKAKADAALADFVTAVAPPESGASEK